MTGIWRIRAAVLMLVGVVVVHQGRFLFATPEHEHELATAHTYLMWLAPFAGVLLFLAVVQLAAHVRREAGRSVELPRTCTLWVVATMALLGVFGAQESFETLFSHGHLPTLGELLGAGGWSAVPLAVLTGAAIALLLRGAAAAVRWVQARRRAPTRRAAVALAVPVTPVLAPCGSVLGRRLAGRGPPAFS